MFSNAKVGDKVFDYLKQEWGVIQDVDNSQILPLLVKFSEKSFGGYTYKGTISIYDTLPILFWDEVKPITPPEKPIPDLEVDTKVIVWNNNCPRNKLKAYFSHFKDGKIYCFDSGTTSWSATTTFTWDNWELVDELN